MIAVHKVAPATFRVVLIDRTGKEHVSRVHSAPADSFRADAITAALRTAGNKAKVRLAGRGIHVRSIASVVCVD